MRLGKLSNIEYLNMNVALKYLVPLLNFIINTLTCFSNVDTAEETELFQGQGESCFIFIQFQ